MREIHTVDEHIRATAFAKVIKLYASLILNSDPDHILRQIMVIKYACPYMNQGRYG